MELDRYDRAILRLLQQDARITNTLLAEKVSLSESACLRRVPRASRNQVLDPGLYSPAGPAEGRVPRQRVREHHTRPPKPVRSGGLRERRPEGAGGDGVLSHDG